MKAKAIPLGGTPRERILAVVLAAAGVFAGTVDVDEWIEEEGYTERAIIPTKGDRWTVGHGSTFWENGKPVQRSDTITRERALALAIHGLSKDQIAVAKTLPGVKLYPEELRIYTNFVGQFGIGNWIGSTPQKALLNGNYLAACHGLLLYKYSAGFDCSTPGNKVCAGVWSRQLRRHAACLEAQEG